MKILKKSAYVGGAILFGIIVWFLPWMMIQHRQCNRNYHFAIETGIQSDVTSVHFVNAKCRVYFHSYLFIKKILL